MSKMTFISNFNEVKYLVIDMESFDYYFFSNEEEAYKKVEDIRQYLLYEEGLTLDCSKPILLYKLFQLYNRGIPLYRDHRKYWNAIINRELETSLLKLDIVCINYLNNELVWGEDIEKYILPEIFNIPVGFYYLIGYYRLIIDLERIEID